MMWKLAAQATARVACAASFHIIAVRYKKLDKRIFTYYNGHRSTKMNGKDDGNKYR